MNSWKESFYHQIAQIQKQFSDHLVISGISISASVVGLVGYYYIRKRQKRRIEEEYQGLKQELRNFQNQSRELMAVSILSVVKLLSTLLCFLRQNIVASLKPRKDCPFWRPYQPTPDRSGY